MRVPADASSGLLMTSTSSTWPSGIVRQHDLQRAKHRHHARRAEVQILAHAVLELRHVDDVFLLRHADAGAEVADRLRRVAAAPQAADRRHPRIVPAGDVPLLHELQQLALAHHRVVQVEARELVLMRLVALDQVVHQPVVQRPVILVLERADRVRDPLDRVRERMRVVVHRVDAPGVAGAVVRGVADPVERRVAHVEVRRRHVDLRAQHVRAVRELVGAHPREQIEVLLDRSIAIRAVLPRLGQRAAVRADLVGAQAVDVGLALLDQLDGELIEPLEVVRRVELGAPREAEPRDVLLDRVDVLDVFLRRVGVVEAQVADAAALGGDPEVQADRLRVADVQVAVRLRRKPRRDAAVVPCLSPDRRRRSRG